MLTLARLPRPEPSVAGAQLGNRRGIYSSNLTLISQPGRSSFRLFNSSLPFISSSFATEVSMGLLSLREEDGRVGTVQEREREKKESQVGKRKKERRKGGESGISPVEIALTQSVFASYKEMNRQEEK